MVQDPKIIIHSDEPEPLLMRLSQADPAVEAAGCDSYDGLHALVPAFQPDIVYSIRFAGTPLFPKAALFSTGGPEWISVGGSGTDHLGQWDPQKVTVTNAAGVASAMMAEYAIGAFLHFSLDIKGLEQDRQKRVWASRNLTPLKGKTVLIVGLGHTGQAVAERAKAFGMQVLGTRARPVQTPFVDHVYASTVLPDLWERADFIVVCVPLLESTRGLLGDVAFAAMQAGAVVVDVSRGGVIDQGALIRALTTGKIAGAALDVFETEPLPPENPLWQLANVLISPHCSSVYEGWEAVSFQMFLDNLARWRAGTPLENVVNPARGY